MKTGNHIKNMFFAALGLTLISWAVFAFLYWKIEIKNAENSRLFNEISEQTARKEEIRSLARETENLGEEIAELDKIFIGQPQEEVVKFIENIEAVAVASGVEISIDEVKVSPLANEKLSEKFEKIDLRLEAEGGWSETFHFLKLLENLPNHIVFKKMELDLIAASDNEDVMAWKAYLDFSVSKIK